MKKNDFIYTGSALYRISKIENNLVKVVPTSRKMTCSLASRTYHQSQLEDLGYYNTSTYSIYQLLTHSPKEIKGNYEIYESNNIKIKVRKEQ